jgi:hypothetical protein
VKKQYTREEILAMTLKEYFDFVRDEQASAREEDTSVRIVRAEGEFHWHDLFPEVKQLCDSYMATPNDETIKAIACQPHCVIIMCWFVLCRLGIDNLPLARRIHNDISEIVLNLFPVTK